MAIYPTDATFNVNNFTTLGSVIYSNTGATATDFNLSVAVNNRGEVLAIIDGILQQQNSYALSNSNFTVSFFGPPVASNLTLKSITVPDRFSKITQFPTLKSVVYSNTSTTTVNSNTYIIDGATTTFSVPSATNPTNKNDLLVALSGVLQDSTSYTYPSATLDNLGVDLPSAPSGANTILDIRVFDTGVSTRTTCRRNSIADRSPDKGYSESKKIDSVIFESIGGYEKRRLVSRRSKRSWQFSYTKVSGIEKEAIQTFYDNRHGEYESFTFDLTHIEQVGTARVRFDGDLSTQHIQTLGANLDETFYKIDLKFKEVWD